MRWLKISILVILLYAICPKQQLYNSASQQENPNIHEIESIRRFFTSYNSSLSMYATTFLAASKKNKIDWKLMPAIAMEESGGGKNTPFCAPFNPFGYTSTSSPCGFWRFTSYEQAIDKVAQTIGRGNAYARYQRTGRLSEFTSVYNPGSKEYQGKLEYFENQL